MMATLSFILFKKKSDIKICVCIRNESLFDCQSKLYTSTAPAVLNIAHFGFTLPQNVACNISGNKLRLKARTQTYICTHLRMKECAIHTHTRTYVYVQERLCHIGNCI